MIKSLILAALLFATNLHATPTHYRLNLTATEVGTVEPHWNLVEPYPSVGDRFYVHMTVSEFVPLDTYSLGKISNIYARMSTALWDSSKPSSHNHVDIEQNGFDGIHAGFPGDRKDGYLTFDDFGIHGGITGWGDATYLDFWGTDFVAVVGLRTYHLDGYHYAFSTIKGTFTITQVSEPGVLALVLLGLLGFRFGSPDRKEQSADS